MSPPARHAWWLAPCVALLLPACTADSPDDATPPSTDGVTAISVTVPPERLTPFCQGMIDLSEQLLDVDSGDMAKQIIETYRELAPEAPDVIAVDFQLVLDALEAGAPPPTDPPLTTTVVSTTAGGVFFDEGYGPGRSPTERINDYVAFACRATGNNPGPPPTEPLENVVEDDGLDDADG